jgi:hypothetical protein
LDAFNVFDRDPDGSFAVSLNQYAVATDGYLPEAAKPQTVGVDALEWLTQKRSSDVLNAGPLTAAGWVF